LETVEESILTLDANQSTVIQQIGNIETVYSIVKKEFNAAANSWKYNMAGTDGTIYILEINVDVKRFSISPSFNFDGAQRIEYKYN
jgi:hypothetical protein